MTASPKTAFMQAVYITLVSATATKTVFHHAASVSGTESVMYNGAGYLGIALTCFGLYATCKTAGNLFRRTLQ